MLWFIQCIELMGDGCLNSEHFEEMGGILKSKLEEHFKNQELRQGDMIKNAACFKDSKKEQCQFCFSFRSQKAR